MRKRSGNTRGWGFPPGARYVEHTHRSHGHAIPGSNGTPLGGASGGHQRTRARTASPNFCSSRGTSHSWNQDTNWKLFPARRRDGRDWSDSRTYMETNGAAWNTGSDVLHKVQTTWTQDSRKRHRQSPERGALGRRTSPSTSPDPEENEDYARVGTSCRAEVRVCRAP